MECKFCHSQLNHRRYCPKCGGDNFDTVHYSDLELVEVEPEKTKVTSLIYHHFYRSFLLTVGCILLLCYLFSLENYIYLLLGIFHIFLSWKLKKFKKLGYTLNKVFLYGVLGVSAFCLGIACITLFVTPMFEFDENLFNAIQIIMASIILFLFSNLNDLYYNKRKDLFKS